MSESSRAQVRSAMGRRKDQLVEIVTWLAFSNMLVVAGLEFMSGTSVLFRASLGLIPFGMLMPMVLLCNRSGRQLTARWLLMVTISLATLSQVVIFHGTDIRTYFYFGCVAVAAPVVLPWRHRAITFLFIGLNILGFVWMDSVQFHPSPGLMDLQGTWVVRALNAWARLALIVSIAMLIWGMEFLTRRTEMELDALATTDILTGLFNRRGGEKLLKRELALASRRHAALWLALVDIDHFKRVNDCFGHEAGDEVLRQVAQELSAQARDVDYVVRWGGEEFLLIMPSCNDAHGACAAAERTRKAIAARELAVAGAAPVAVTISIGLASVLPGGDLDAALVRVDQAMYQAKEGGRNRVVVDDGLNGILVGCDAMDPGASAD